MRGLLLIVALLALATARVTAAEYDAFQSGKWDGAATRSDASGQFTHCAMMDRTAGYPLFFFSIGGDDVFNVFFADPSWRLVLGQRHPVSLDIDGGRLGRYEAFTASDTVMGIRFGTGRAEFGALQQGNRLTLRTAQRDYTFSLADTGRALQRLQDCVDQHVAGKGAADPVKPDAPSRNPFKAGPGPGPRAYTREEIIRILSKAGIREAQLLSTAETSKHPDFAHMWALDGTLGFVAQALRDPNASVDEQMARFLGRLTDDCKGESASAADPARTQGVFVFKEGFVSCVGESYFFVYTVALFETSRLSIFGYIASSRDDLPTAAAAMAKLIGVLQQMYY
jgi:hypothetical protein